MILNAIADSRNQRKEGYKDNIKLVSEEDIFIEADKGRI